ALVNCLTFYLFANVVAICALHFLMPRFLPLEHRTNDILLLIYTVKCSVHDEMAHEAFHVSEAYRRYRAFVIPWATYLQINLHSRSLNPSNRPAIL
ncbi:MAG: hypothetical protein ACYTXY_45250, partial [Nostoc sp.]